MHVNPFSVLRTTITARLESNCSTAGKAAKTWTALLEHCKNVVFAADSAQQPASASVTAHDVAGGDACGMPSGFEHQVHSVDRMILCY